MPLGHLGINVPDLATAKAHYDLVMPLLDHEQFVVTDEEVGYRPIDGKIGTWLFLFPTLTDSTFSATATGLGHLAFIVKTRAAVHAIHDLVTTHGCTVVHPPQEFPEYHPGYYAVFWQDPFGMVLEAVCHQES